MSHIVSPLDSGLQSPQPNTLEPDTLAGRLWAAGELGPIDDLMTAAVSSLKLSDAELADLRLYAEERSWAIQALAEAFQQPEDEPDLYPTIASFWLELRFDWQRHNEVMNYAATRMTPLPRVVGHGAVSSAILGRLEDLLSPQHRDQLSQHAIHLLEGVLPASYHAANSS